MTECKSKYPLVEFSVLKDHRFITIHPFKDGNRKTGRLLINLLLMRSGYHIAIIQKNDRAKYYNALDGVVDAGDLLFIAQMAV